jgi:hypothetical protein
MGAGINISALLSFSASISEPIIIASDVKNIVTGGIFAESSGPWTPPQYAQPALTILTVPPSSNTSNGQPATSATNYVFDAVFRLMHTRRLTKTKHPVLTGANISDHAYIECARVTLEIGMSDAMSSFADGVWVGAATKSISAWQIIKGLQTNKTLLTLTTRLDTYFNMLVVEATSPDEVKTLHGLRASIVLEEQIAGSIASQAVSRARPQTSGSTSGGTIQGTSPNASQVQQNVIPSTLYPDTPTFPQVPGAGNVSSNSLGQVPNE